VDLKTRIQMAPKGVFFIAGLVLLSMYYYVVYDDGESMVQTTKNAAQELEAARKSLTDVNTVLADYGKFQAEFQLVSDQFQAALEYLPESFNIMDLLKQISDEARAAGVNLINVKPKPVETKEFYDELAIDVELEGPFALLTTFLAYMSKQNRIVNVKDVRIDLSKIVDSTPRLNMRGVLVAYKYKKAIPKEEVKN